MKILKKRARKLTKKVPIKKNLPEKETEPIKKTKIRVLGVGGGGGTIVSEISLRVRGASFAAANTDYQALKQLRRNVSGFQFGQNLTGGLGTGMNWELAEKAALEEKERIKKLFQGFDFCILISSLGGGTGSGATPIFAKIAKNAGVLTLGVFTLPFGFEGEKKQEIAREALQKLKSHFNAIAVLPNDRIFQVIEKDTPLKEALSAINRNLAEGIQGLIETIYLPGLINIDFADLKTTLEGQGKVAYLNTVEAEGGEEKITELVRKVLNNPIYPYTIRGGKRALFNIVGEKDLLLFDVSNVCKTIFEQVNPEAKIIFGVARRGKGKNAPGRNRIKVSLLVTGCAVKLFSNGEPKSKKITKKKKPKSKPPEILAQAKPEPKPFVKTPVRKKSTPKLTSKNRPKPKNKPKKKQKKLPMKNPRANIKKEEKPTLKSETTNSKKAPETGVQAVKIRKNALQIKKETEEAEKEFLEKERFWETPAFLRNQRT